jgi:hypothetical protein
MGSKKSRWLYAMGLFTLGLICTGVIYWRHDVGTNLNKKTDQPNADPAELDSRTFIDTKTGVKFSYSSLIQPVTLSNQDITEGFIFRGQDSSTDKNRPYLISIRSEEAASSRKAAAVTKQPILDMLLDNARKTYPARYKGFKEIASRTIQLAFNQEAKELIFTYQSQARLAKQGLIVLETQSRLVYLSFQAYDDDYNNLDLERFKRIQQSMQVMNY